MGLLTYCDRFLKLYHIGSFYFLVAPNLIWSP